MEWSASAILLGVLSSSSVSADIQCPITYLDMPGGGNAVPVCEDVPTRPAGPPPPDTWGAIAISAATSAWGNSWKYKSEKEAVQRALANCQSQKGARDCRVAITVVNVCVAVALSKEDAHLAVGGPYDAVDIADERALINCKRIGGKYCAITGHVCADGVLHMAKQPVPFGRRPRK